MSLKPFDHFGSRWASGKRTRCCGDPPPREARGSAASSWRGRRRRPPPPRPLRATPLLPVPRDGGRGAAGGHGAGRDTLPPPPPRSGTAQAGARGLGPALEAKPRRRRCEFSGLQGEDVKLQFSKENLRKKIKATKPPEENGNFGRRFSWTGSDSSFQQERR